MEKIMKKTKILFIIWVIIVIIIIGLLTTMGFIIKNRTKDYEKLENKLVDSAKDYAINNILLDDNDTTTISSELLQEKGYLDKLELDNDVCSGYVVINNDGTFKYKAFIKCKHYKTLNYSENK